MVVSALRGAMSQIYDVVVIGAGAAGIGAGQQLAKTQVQFLLVEARDRVGGRAHTIQRGGETLDCGCHWLHSGDRNVMTETATSLGFHLDRSPAPWSRQSSHQLLSSAEEAQFGRAFAEFERRIDAEAEKNPPVPASAYLEPGSRWTPMMNAIFSYISGASLDHIDARDYARYEDTGVNYRVAEGYGALFAACASALPVQLETEVQAIDWGADRVSVRTNRGVIEARTVIVTLPTTIYANVLFTPSLPEKREAAAGLPLGYAEKLHFALSGAEEFPKDGHLFARFDSADIASYHLRPGGRPMIEVYFGGSLAKGLVAAGPEAMQDFAFGELSTLLGSEFPKRLTLLASTAWSRDPYALGSYSYAEPGFAEMRAVLAAPVSERLFFAGEACSRHRYSTAHGAYETGYAAAEQALEALGYGSMPTG